MLTIDGAYGEAGGQILRTSLSLAVILNRPVCIEKIRAGRKNPGLAAQHVTCARAAAMICDAELQGDRIGSARLTFEPRRQPIAGLYEFDVAAARQGGSAGAAALVLQTVLLPLTLADGPSTVTVRGGTHVKWSPSCHYLRAVYLPLIGQLGFEATLELQAWGWYPVGEGEITAEIWSRVPAKPNRIDDNHWFKRGALGRIQGVAVASSLPAHIAQRMSDRATKILGEAGLTASIEPQRVRSASPGAGIFLAVEFETHWAGFGAIGRQGQPAEQVAEEASRALLAFIRSGAVLDVYAADQLILPLIFSGYAGLVSAEHISRHTLTNLWVVEQFLGPVAKVDRSNKTICFDRIQQELA
jgi:RNA 3'-terminal phosphate cyclase (ATP)